MFRLFYLGNNTIRFAAQAKEQHEGEDEEVILITTLPHPVLAGRDGVRIPASK